MTKFISEICLMIKKKTVVLIVFLSLTVIGLLWMQFYWINFSFKEKSDAFDIKVNQKLAHVATEVEESFFCIDFFSDLNASIGEKLVILKKDTLNQIDTIPLYFWNQWSNDSLQRYPGIGFSYPANIRMEFNVEYQMREDTSILKDVSTINSYRISLHENTGFKNTVDSVLMKYFNEDQISTDFKYQLIEISTKETISGNLSDKDEPKQSEASSVQLFSENYFFSPLTLQIWFPNKKSNLIKELWGLVIISIFLILLLVFILSYFIRLLIQQHKLSEMKSEFISNMTHEFKTPVANINLALDTIEKSGLSENEQLQLYAGIIREENRRLKNNIDLILETSLMDKDSLQIKKSTINLHELISGIIEIQQIEIQESGGIIDLRLIAEKYVLEADEIHISNSIFNVIDNAIKYSPDEPKIEIATSIKDKYFVIAIKDYGKGIPNDAQGRIFEKLYRVPDGNKHDVKGFGIGLYYAKNVIEAHGGLIKVKSELGKGSLFELYIPF